MYNKLQYLLSYFMSVNVASDDAIGTALGNCQSHDSAVICQPVVTRPNTDKKDPIKSGGQILIDRPKVWGWWEHKVTAKSELGLHINFIYGWWTSLKMYKKTNTKVHAQLIESNDWKSQGYLWNKWNRRVLIKNKHCVRREISQMIMSYLCIKIYQDIRN